MTCHGINVIQVVPLFCLNKIRCCKASNVFDDLRCVYIAQKYSPDVDLERFMHE